MFKASKLFEVNYNSTADIIINQGGSSSGKTYSIIQNLFCKAVSNPVVITIVGESIPNLKAGSLRDALDIYNNSESLKVLIPDYNKSERIFKAINGSIIEFKSYLTSQDAKSGKRDYLFINEAQGISPEIFNELHLRTRLQTYIDYNPNEEFWVHEQLIGGNGVELFISDHRDNPFVPEKIREKLEALRFKDMDLFKVYARGLTGRIEGLIYRNYRIINSVPPEAKFISYWLDWGFTNDPTSFGGVYRYNGELILDELIYETGLTNSDIISRLKGLGVKPNHEIIADSAEPKSIEDLRRAGFFVSASKKGPDSNRKGIDIIKQFFLNITNSSLGLKKEIKSYKWKVDSNGKTLNEPVDFLNHSLDGVKYVGLNKLGENNHISVARF